MRRVNEEVIQCKRKIVELNRLKQIKNNSGAGPVEVTYIFNTIHLPSSLHVIPTLLLSSSS